MVNKPVIEQRSEQPFLAIPLTVNMKDISSVLPPLIGEVNNWIKENNIPSDCTPFFHYQAINEKDELDVVVGSLVQGNVMGNGHIVKGFFPAGKYAVITYMGDYKNIMEGHMALEKWVRQNDLKEKRQETENGIKWGGRTEFYVTDPQTEPNPENWRTDIAFLLED